MTKAELIQTASKAATDAGLDPALVCAIVEQESGWHPFVTRYEPAFERHYIAPLNLDWSETKGRSTSFGLMQCMGEILRELGYTGGFSSLMDDVATEVALGCKHFKNKLARAGGDVRKALQLWNGGGNLSYADQVMARLSKYQAQKPPQSAEAPKL